MPWIAKVHSVVAEPGRIIEKYERTPRPAMIRIGDADQMRSGPP
jgi:hypothetical protein